MSIIREQINNNVEKLVYNGKPASFSGTVIIVDPDNKGWVIINCSNDDKIYKSIKVSNSVQLKPYLYKGFGASYLCSMNNVKILGTEILSNNWYTLKKVTYEFADTDGQVKVQNREAYDRGKKFEHYQQIESLVDYLLISQTPYRVEQFTRQGDRTWMYREFRGGDEIVQLDSVG